MNGDLAPGGMPGSRMSTDMLNQIMDTGQVKRGRPGPAGQGVYGPGAPGQPGQGQPGQGYPQQSQAQPGYGQADYGPAGYGQPGQNGYRRPVQIQRTSAQNIRYGQGYVQPGQGYGQPAQGYAQPAQGYAQPGVMRPESPHVRRSSISSTGTGRSMFTRSKKKTDTSALMLDDDSGDEAHVSNVDHLDSVGAAAVTSLKDVAGLRDRDRYPSLAGADTSQGSRTMSMTSSSFDTAPVIPTFTGTTPQKAKQLDYRKKQAAARNMALTDSMGPMPNLSGRTGSMTGMSGPVSSMSGMSGPMSGMSSRTGSMTRTSGPGSGPMGDPMGGPMSPPRNMGQIPEQSRPPHYWDRRPASPSTSLSGRAMSLGARAGYPAVNAAPVRQPPQRSSRSALLREAATMTDRTAESSAESGAERSAEIGAARSADFTADRSAQGTRVSTQNEGTQDSQLENPLEKKQLLDELRTLSHELGNALRAQLNLEPRSADPPTLTLVQLQDELDLERRRRMAAEARAYNNVNTTQTHEHQLVDAQRDLTEKAHELQRAQLELKQTTAAMEKIRAENDQLRDQAAGLKSDMQHAVSGREELAAAGDPLDLLKQIELLKVENKKLETAVMETSSRGPLGEKIKAVESQRDNLRDALRSLRTTKDQELRQALDRLRILESKLERERLVSAQLQRRLAAPALDLHSADPAAVSVSQSASGLSPSPSLVHLAQPPPLSLDPPSLSLRRPSISSLDGFSFHRNLSSSSLSLPNGRSEQLPLTLGDAAS